MTGIALWLLAFGLSMASTSSDQPSTEQVKAVAEIEKLGGKIVFEKKGSRNVVVAVDLSTEDVTDAGVEHLQDLASLRSLNLLGTKVTNVTLERLQGLGPP